MNRTINQNPARPASDPSGIAVIRAIRAAERCRRERFPILRHQTALGMGFVCLAYGLAAATAWLYLTGSLPAWVCILTNAIAFSVLREIEHDLIHNLYFTGKRARQNFVLFVIWPALGNVPSPLYRRLMHLQHHRSSGTEADLEERLIGNGTGFGPMRWFIMIDTGLSTLFRRRELEQIPGYRRSELLHSLIPVVAVFYVAWLSFLIYHLTSLCLTLAGAPTAVPASLASWVRCLDAVAVIWILPNVIRQASVQILSSTMHYYGDVHGVVQQTQVLSKWYWLPLQLLSCNFGNSHAIHHFVASQPFYLRELLRREAHAAMRLHGVRFDDLRTFERANSWGNRATPVEPPVPVIRAPKTQGSTQALCAGILFLELAGKLDSLTAKELEETLAQSIATGARRLAVDFSHLDQISDTGLRVLLHAARSLMKSGGKLALHSLNHPVRQAFQQTGFSLLFPIHRSREEAVRWLSMPHPVTMF